MRDFLGLICLIIAAALVTKHFALGIPPFALAVWLMVGKGSLPSADTGAAILSGIGVLCMIGVIIMAIFQAIF